MRDVLIYVIASAFSFVCYGTTALLGWISPDPSGQAMSPMTVTAGCLFLVAANVALVFLRSNPVAVYTILGLKTAATLLIGIPLEVSDGREEILYYALMAECLLYLPGLWGSVWSGITIVFSCFNQQQWVTWDYTVPAASGPELFMYASRLGVVLILATLIRALILLYRHRSQELGHLEKSVQGIVDANLDLQSYAVEVERRTTEDERKRLTREIHDIIGYSMTNQLMMVEAGLLLIDREPERLRTLLSSAKEQLQESLEDIRNALHELRAPRPFLQNPYAELEYLCRIFSEATGVRVKVELAVAARPIDEGLFRCLYRIIQQGLTNAFFHGRADLVEVLLSERPGWMNLTMIDNGRGAIEVEEGIGMKGMRERLEPFGGELSWASSGDGFRLMVRIPQTAFELREPKSEHDASAGAGKETA